MPRKLMFAFNNLTFGQYLYVINLVLDFKPDKIMSVVL